MASEGKTEPKIEPKPEPKEPATVAIPVEENPEPPLKYKTLVLKVSVHCEGCKRKVIKILKNIEGVYKVEIDLRQQKVSVIGNVDADTLIKKLLKAGKHAELWPETKADNKEKKKSKSKNKDNKEKQSDQESGDEEEEDNTKETVKNEVIIIQDPSKPQENGPTVKIAEPAVFSSPAGEKPPPVEKKPSEESEGGTAPTAGGSGGGGKKKKKKKKGHNGNNNNNPNPEEGEHGFHGAPAGSGSASQVYAPYGQSHVTSVANHSPPRNFPVHQYPAHYYAPPPVYAVNYNTAQPSASYGGAVYAPPYSYAYMHHGTVSEPLPSDVDSYAPQPSDSFEIFSDENPNACSVM